MIPMYFNSNVNQLYKYAFNYKARRPKGRRAVTLLLLRTLLQVAVTAQHLAVVGHGLSTLAPWHDVVRVHLLVLEMLAADRAHSLLTLIRRPRVAFVERAD